MLTPPDPSNPVSDWTITLEEWRHLGSEAGLEDHEPGRIRIIFGTGGEDYNDAAPLAAEQLVHVDWLVKNHVVLMDDVILETALRLYKAYRMDMVSPDEDDDFLPRRVGRAEIRPVIMPTAVHLTSLPGVDVPYIGIRLAAQWDDEHDLGVLCRGLEVVDVSGDQHIDAFSAEQLERRSGTGTLLDENGYNIS